MNPVVFLDSGVGGLSYFSCVRSRLAHDYLYIADTKIFPYGNKSASVILQSLSEHIHKLQSFCTPKLIVLACNTASTTCLALLRRVFPAIPFVGTVPAVKPAAAKGISIVLLLSTQTAKEGYTKELIAEFGKESRFISMPDDNLIQAIEKDFPQLDSCQIQAAFNNSIRRIQDSGAESIVLACTHFLHLRNAFVDALPALSVFDSLDGIAKRVKTLVDVSNPTSPALLYTTSPSSQYEHIAKELNMEYRGVL